MSGQKPDLKQTFAEQMKRLFGNWTVADREIRTLKAAEFREAFDRYGAERFTLAVRDTIWNHATGFFPTLGEFLNFMPKPIAEGLPSGCEKCRWTGFATTLQNKAIRCACFTDRSLRTPAPKPPKVDSHTGESIEKALNAAAKEKAL